MSPSLLRPCLCALACAGLLSLGGCRRPAPPRPVAADSASTLSYDVMALVQRDPRLTRLAGLLLGSDLEPTLRGDLPITLFAPTNEALNRYFAPTDTLPMAEKTDSLRVLLRHHLLRGRLEAFQIGDSTTVSTLLDEPLVLMRHDSGGFTADGHRVAPAVPARNGMLYVVPHLLAPPPPDTTQTSFAQVD